MILTLTPNHRQHHCQQGYGGYSVSEAVEVAGLDHVMVTAWNGDNQGPSTSAELVKQFKAIAKEFPGAAVFASSFDNFTSLLDAVNESIPVLTQEIGDTWIYGTPSDPVKQATMRASMRAWSQYNAAGGAKDAVYLNATRLLVKSIEHTWGDHVELGAWQLASSWTNTQFESDRHSSTHEASQTFQFLESTWWEQRQFCTEYAADTLAAAKHPLWEQYLEPELAAVNKPVVAPTPIAAGSGFVSFDPESAGPIKSGGISINFDSASGAISYLVDQHGRSWASADRTLLSMNYQTYNISQFQQFQRAYSNLTNPPSYFPHDFGTSTTLYLWSSLFIIDTIIPVVLSFYFGQHIIPVVLSFFHRHHYTCGPLFLHFRMAFFVPGILGTSVRARGRPMINSWMFQRP